MLQDFCDFFAPACTSEFLIILAYSASPISLSSYDHFSGLCELLPTALPSLALCLATVIQGKFTPQMHSKVSKDLGFSSNIPVRPTAIKSNR